MLDWNETDFLECLEVIPEKIEDEAGGPLYIFYVSKNKVELELTVFPFEEDVRFRLFLENENYALFEYQIMGCKYARLEKNHQGQEYLLFGNEDGLQTTVSVNPDIQVLLTE